MGIINKTRQELEAHQINKKMAIINLPGILNRGQTKRFVRSGF